MDVLFVQRVGGVTLMFVPNANRALASNHCGDPEGEGAMSNNWPTSDRSRWVVPIIVALVAAGGTVIAALAPSLFVGDGKSASSDVDATKAVLDGVPDTGRPTIERPANPPAIAGNTFTEYSGSEILTSSDPAVDLDATMGDNAGGDNIGDLVHTDRALTTGGGAQIAVLDRAQIPSLEICRSVLDERGVTTVAVSQLEDGVPLCVRTTAGRTGAINQTMVYKFGEQLGVFGFSYVIWDAASE